MVNCEKIAGSRIYLEDDNKYMTIQIKVVPKIIHNVLRSRFKAKKGKIYCMKKRFGIKRIRKCKRTVSPSYDVEFKSMWIDLEGVRRNSKLYGVWKEYAKKNRLHIKIKLDSTI